MSRAILLSLFAATAAVAGVPVTFSQGSPAKADEVNKNFTYLDTVKADKAAVSVLQTAVAAKANQSDLDSLRARVSYDTMAPKSISLPGLIFRIQENPNYVNKVAAIYGDSLSQGPTQHNYALYIRRDGRESYINGSYKTGLAINNTDILVATSTEITATKPIIGTFKTAVGTIKSSDVADYVFEPDYKLMPLAEVEAFTKTNKHLPEVPSAAEIEKSGLDLAKMNLILLKKVEELTLHTIELEKRLKAVEAKN